MGNTSKLDMSNPLKIYDPSNVGFGKKKQAKSPRSERTLRDAKLNSSRHRNTNSHSNVSWRKKMQEAIEESENPRKRMGNVQVSKKNKQVLIPGTKGMY